MSQKSLKKNAIFSVLRSFASICFPIISFPYISRILNPEGIGKINFANSFVDYFIMFAGLGITSYAGREAAKIRENKTELNKLSKELVIINSISTIVSYLVLFILTFSVPKFSQYLLLITICSSKILFETLGLNWLFIAEEDYGYITIRSIIFQFLSLICMFIFVHTEQDLFIYAIITVISSVGSNIFNLFYARKYINIFEKTKVELKKHLSPIFVFFGVSIAGRIYASIDTLMLGFMSDDKAIGIYTAANKITFMVNSLLAAAVVVIMPKAANLFSQNKTSEYLALVNKRYCPNNNSVYCMAINNQVGPGTDTLNKWYINYETFNCFGLESLYYFTDSFSALATYNLVIMTNRNYERVDILQSKNTCNNYFSIFFKYSL